MKITEENRDILTVDDNEYYLVQWISADFARSAGIVTECNTNYNIKLNCILCDNRVFNLIIKENCFSITTYEMFRDSLVAMRRMLLSTTGIPEIKTNKIAIPKIIYHDVDWDIAKFIIKDVFKDTNVEILICSK